MYIQVYLFIILYYHWIATNIIQYLIYLVVILYEYLSVFTQLYPRKWGQLLYPKIMQPFLKNIRTFHSVLCMHIYLTIVNHSYLIANIWLNVYE